MRFALEREYARKGPRAGDDRQGGLAGSVLRRVRPRSIGPRIRGLRPGSAELLRLELASWLLSAAAVQVHMAETTAADAGVDRRGSPWPRTATVGRQLRPRRPNQRAHRCGVQPGRAERHRQQRQDGAAIGLTWAHRCGKPNDSRHDHQRRPGPGGHHPVIAGKGVAKPACPVTGPAPFLRSPGV